VNVNFLLDIDHVNVILNASHFYYDIDDFCLYNATKRLQFSLMISVTFQDLIILYLFAFHAVYCFIYAFDSTSDN
jgi:hypothetical protein